MKAFFFLLLTSPVFAVEAPLEFGEALKVIVDRSPSVRIQEANWEGVDAKNLSSRLAMLPSLSAQVSQTESDQVGDRVTRRGLMGTAELNLFKFGADAASMRAASAESRTQEFLLQDSVLAAEEDGVKGLVTYLQSLLELETIKEITGIREEASKIARERYQRGALAAQEADKFAIDLDNARARLSDVQTTTIAAGAELEAMLGHRRVKLDWPWKPLFSTDKLLTAVSEERKLSARPDWKASEEKVAAAKQRKNQAWGVVLPSLDLSFSYGYFQNDQKTLGTQFNGPEWQGKLALTIPLFDRLENYGQYRSLVHAEAAAEGELERTRRQAKIEYDSAKGSLQISVQTARLRDQTLTTSRKLYRDNLARFRKGLISANDLIIDQERLTDSQLNAIRGWAQVHTSFSRLCHAMGERVATCLSKVSN